MSTNRILTIPLCIYRTVQKAAGRDGGRKRNAPSLPPLKASSPHHWHEASPSVQLTNQFETAKERVPSWKAACYNNTSVV